MDDTCSINKFETQINFCDDWCNTESIWPGCGVHTLPGDDPRNTDNVDYTCSCSGCNGCSTSSNSILQFYRIKNFENFTTLFSILLLCVTPKVFVGITVQSLLLPNTLYPASLPLL